MFDRQSRQSFFPHFPPEALGNAPSWLMAWADRQRQRAALARLDHRLLKDVGLTRSQAMAESCRRD